MVYTAATYISEIGTNGFTCPALAEDGHCLAIGNTGRLSEELDYASCPYYDNFSEKRIITD
jgi:hypothetical protein